MTNVRANAKVNLWLRVAGKREDGFHEIETVFQSIGLADELSFTLTDAPDLQVSMSYESVPPRLVPRPEDNLVWRAAREMLNRTEHRGASIGVVKRIPTGGGLGGGSADAAAVFVTLNDVLRLGLSTEELTGLAARSGSDTSFSITGGTALGTGRGEQLTPLPTPDLALVLGLSDEPMLTKDTYERWSRGRGESSSDELVNALGQGPEAVAGLLYNDLEEPAFSLRPELRDKKESLLAAGALGALLSGSGPTLFGLCRDERHATEVAAACEKEGLFDQVVPARTRTACVEAGD